MQEANSKAFKQLVRNHMLATGMSYMAAMRDLEKQRNPPEPTTTPTAVADLTPIIPPDRPLHELLATICADSPSVVMLRDVLPVARSANLEHARAQAAALAQRHQRCAESGGGEVLVSPTEEERLIRAGAADGATLKIIRSFHWDNGLTFSVPCPTCARWIHCGHKEREHTCACGQRYRVTFDSPPDWSFKQHMCCLDCGQPHQQTQPAGDFNPWAAINLWQIQCKRCHHARADILAHCAKDGPNGPTTTYRNPTQSILVAARRLFEEGLIVQGTMSELGQVSLGGSSLTMAMPTSAP